MNIQILRELQSYIEHNREEALGPMRGSYFRQRLHLPSSMSNASRGQEKENKDNIKYINAKVHIGNIDHFDYTDNSETLERFRVFPGDRGNSEYRKASLQEEAPEIKFCEPSAQISDSSYTPKEQDLEEYIKSQRSKETFSTRLLQFIDGTGLTDAEIYKRAGIDRRHFSKIRCDKEYRPKKTTVLALCLALQLDENETVELLSLAGYSLSKGDTGDLVISFCIERGIYDLMEVNEALVFFGQKTIGVLE